MRADNFAEIVQDLINVLGDAQGTAGDADHEVIKVDLWDALYSGRADEYSGSATRAGCETQAG